MKASRTPEKVLGEQNVHSVEINCTKFTKALYRFCDEYSEWLNWYRAALGLSGKSLDNYTIKQGMLPTAIYARLLKAKQAMDKLGAEYGNYDTYFEYHPFNYNRNYNLRRLELALNNAYGILKDMQDCLDLAWRRIAENESICDELDAESYELNFKE